MILDLVKEFACLFVCVVISTYFIISPLFVYLAGDGAILVFNWTYTNLIVTTNIPLFSTSYGLYVVLTIAYAMLYIFRTCINYLT